MPTTPVALDGSEFEERMPCSFGEVILGGVVDAYSVSTQKADRWPHIRAKQSAEQARRVERLEHATKNRCPVIRRHFGGVHGTATTARLDHDRLAGCSKVSSPALCTVRGLDVPDSIEVQQGDGNRSLDPRPSTPNDQKNVRRTGWNPGGDHPSGQRIEQLEHPKR
nr:hypothetical protein [Humibacter sp. RRB41]